MKANILCCNGKSLNGSFQNLKNKKATQLFEIFSACDKIGLGHILIKEKDHEVLVMQEPLVSLSFAGSVVTVDALHYQKNHLRPQESQMLP